jgi:pimeloyl-ACP methyl ester carboxylesterase
MPIAANLYYSLSERGAVNQPSLVLIHGTGSSHQCWPAEMRRLPGWNVLAVDLPGHGRSEGVAQRSISRYAAGLAEFLAELNVFQAVLVGHSMGGAIALQMALDQPTLVTGLGVISSGAYLGVPPQIQEYLTNPLTQNQATRFFRGLAFSPAATPALVEQSMAPLNAIPHSVLASDWQACATFDLIDAVENIACPTFLAAGADDRLTPPAYARFLAARMPNARLHLIPDAGHMVIVEQPAELTAHLRDFLTSLFNYQFNW